MAHDDDLEKPPPSRRLKLTHCHVDLGHRKVDWGHGTIFNLTGREAELLEYFWRHPSRVISRDELYRAVWGYRSVSLSRAVDTAIKRVREKIEANPSEPQHIFTSYGVGYRFEPYDGEPGPAEATRSEAEPHDIILVGAKPLESPPGEARSARGGPAALVPRMPLPQEENVPPGNLGPILTVPLAREAESLEILRIYEAEERLVTLLGPPGIGKSTLATHLGHQLSRSGLGFTSVWFCDLVEARNLDEVLSLLLLALESCSTSADRLESDSRKLEKYLTSLGRALIILDNVERLIEWVPQMLGRWLYRFPQLRWLVTSRERLPLDQGVTFVVEALPEAAAVQLFVSRARLQRRDFSPSPAQGQVIKQLVQQLDRIPLALELAAARIAVLSPEQILERLTARFELLRRSRVTQNQRHDSMRRAIDWSWELLDPVEREAMAQLALFRGGFSLAAAEAVVDVSGGPEAPPILDLLQLLVSRSLVHVETRATTAQAARPGEMASMVAPRFHMYECIREYAAERLDGLPSREAARKRHADYFLSWAEAQVQRLRNGGGQPGLMPLTLERANLEDMFRHYEATDPDALARSALAMHALSHGRESRSVRLARLNAAVAFADSISLRLRIRLRTEWCGSYLITSGGTQSAVETCQGVLKQTLEWARELGDPALEAEVLFHLSRCFLNSHEAAGGMGYLEAARALCQTAGLARLELQIRLSLTAARFKVGLEQECTPFSELVAEATSIQDSTLETIFRGILAEIMEELGEFAGAESMALTMADAAQRQALLESEVIARLVTGRAQVDLGRYDDVLQSYRLACARAWETDNPVIVGVAHCELSSFLHLLGRPQEALETHRVGFQYIARLARPDLAQYYVVLSAIEAAVGQFDAALASLETARHQLRGADNLSSRCLLTLGSRYLEIQKLAATDEPRGTKAWLQLREHALQAVAEVEAFPSRDPLLSPTAPLQVQRFLLRQMVRLVRQSLQV